MSAAEKAMCLKMAIGGSMADLSGYKTYESSYKIETNKKRNKSYGFLYAQNADENSLKDFNRFRDGAILEQTPNASMSSSTYDLFFASAQGMGASFRGFRSDIGTMNDPDVKMTGESSHMGGEEGGFLYWHSRTETGNSTMEGKSGAWATGISQTLAARNLYKNVVPNSNSASFTANAKDAFIEQFYFKQFGELTARDENYETSISSTNLVAPQLQDIGGGYKALSPISGQGRTKRDIRTNYIRYLSARQASDYGFEKTYKLYDANTYSISSNRMVAPSSISTNTNVSRTLKTSALTGTYLVNEHISEVSMTNSNGSRYVYGIPSYNHIKKVVSFNASARTETLAIINGESYPKPSSYVNSPLSKSTAAQLVEYADKDKDDNNRGRDNFCQKNTTPGYASQYLLTNVLSSDYVDVTGNGTSYDDLGSFTKFNYSKASDYHWRDPFCMNSALATNSVLAGSVLSASNQAHYEPGLVSDDNDDRAFYQYGVRENYYLHSIETKNFVAVFKTSGRLDAMGVQAESGIMTTSIQTQKLDAIELYSKSEILAKGSIANATPLKVAHFEYNYSLCPNTFNTLPSGNTLPSVNPTRSKLTLTKVYFTYGRSAKSGLSPYEFSYADNDHNPSTNTTYNSIPLLGECNYPYNPNSNDRWGMYKPNLGSATGSTLSTELNNNEFPYAEQNKTLADQYAAAWNLTEIKTPSGSTIKITYEADDYGFIGNKDPGLMIKIVDCPATINPSLSVAQTYTNAAPDISKAGAMIIDLSAMSIGIPTTVALADANINAKEFMLRKNEQGYYMYFKCFMKLASKDVSGFTKDYYDYVTGYAPIDKVGFFDPSITANTYQSSAITGTSTTTCYRYAYVMIKNSGKYIQEAGWQFLRYYLPGVAYPGSEPAYMGNSNFTPEQQYQDALTGLGIAKTDFDNAKKGNPNQRFADQHFCESIVPGKSFVRLHAHHSRKIGGGHRVKQITTEDNWNSMTGSINTTSYAENSTLYGQSFDYTMDYNETYGVANANTRTIKMSSGVASYEPMVGADEISWRAPIEFDVKKTLAPNDHFFQESPLGEALYPSPLVGYSQVTIRPIADPNSGLVCGNGKSVYEFYTAKDFPITDVKTNLSPGYTNLTPEPKTLLKFFKHLDSPNEEEPATKIYHTAQGFMLKFNNMHGKLKSIAQYGEASAKSPISKVEYFYKSKTKTDGNVELETSALCIDENNVISKRVMARDIDVTADTRENISTMYTQGENKIFDIGVAITPLPVPPFVLPLPDPFWSKNDYEGGMKYGFRGATLTKVVQEYGILDRVDMIYNGSKTSTQNLLWDANTGNVLLTKTTNNYDDDIFNFNYPAYWAYPQMKHEYTRQGITLYCEPTSAQNPNPVWDVSTGVLTASVVNGTPLIFEIGDEVTVYNISSASRIAGRFWIFKDPGAAYPANYILVDQNGRTLNTTNYGSLGIATSNTYRMTLVRPINRNKIDAQMGSVTSMVNPITVSGTNTLISYSNSSKVVSASALEFSGGGAAFVNSTLSNQLETNLTASNTVTCNPVIAGLYGDFKPVKQYRFKTTRSYQTSPNPKADGTYSGFTPFWTYLSTTTIKRWETGCYTNTNTPLPAGWIQFAENNVYSPYGELIESRNAIGLSSCQRLGFNHTLPVLSANNANQRQVAFDSFEEYPTVYTNLSAISTSTAYNANVFNNDYLGFYRNSAITNTTLSTAPTFTNSSAHTGRYSMLFTNNQNVVVKLGGSITSNKLFTLFEDVNPYLACTGNLNSTYDCSGLNLNAGDYVISLWIKGLSPSTNFNYTNLISLKVTEQFSSATTNTVLTPVSKTEIINGWQKVDYQVKLTGSPELKISSSSAGGFYLDDFRIQPFNSTMVCNVYDPYQLRLWAQLDDRNFATLYEYDQEGVLVRKKKETVTTIYTLDETRLGKSKR
jgi:hypothetical protein